MNETYAGDIRCDAGRMFEYPSDFMTVGSSNTGRMQFKKSSRYSGSEEWFFGNWPGSLFSSMTR